MEKGLELVDYFYSLITEEQIADSFAKKKLRSKFNSYRIVYKRFPTIVEVIDLIIEEFFQCDSIVKVDVIPEPLNDKPINVLNYVAVPSNNIYRQIALTGCYTNEEIAIINRLFGFSPHNRILTLEALESGYVQNKGIDGIESWYQYLKFYHFTDHSQLSEKELVDIYRRLDQFMVGRQRGDNR